MTKTVRQPLFKRLQGSGVNVGDEICREHENDIEKYNKYLHYVTAVITVVTLLGVAMICGSINLLVEKDTAKGIPLFMLGVWCIWSIYREPFLFMKWKTRIVQCRQRTYRLRDLIELEKIVPPDSGHSAGKDDSKRWFWRLKELMNVRAYFWSPYATCPPWSYDQVENAV